MNWFLFIVILAIATYGALWIFGKKHWLKKAKYFIQKFDAVWSLPAAIVGFWLLGLLLVNVFGFAAGTYDIGFFQPLILAAGVVVGATNFGVMGVYFTLRGIHRFLYGYKDENGNLVNYSKRKWRALRPIEQFMLSFFVLFYFITSIIIVYLKFV